MLSSFLKPKHTLHSVIKDLQKGAENKSIYFNEIQRINDGYEVKERKASSLIKYLRTKDRQETVEPTKSSVVVSDKMPSTEPDYPRTAWVVVFAAMSLNLCLGVLYSWSIWKSAFANAEMAGLPMTGINEGWMYLNNSQATIPFSLCVIVSALQMLPGGRIESRITPRFGATLGGLTLVLGCFVAGLSKSYAGVVIGFGVLGGCGIGIAYASTLPVALRWFAPKMRRRITGIVVGGFSGAAIYLGFVVHLFIDKYGITGSFVGVGFFFAIVISITGLLLRNPPEGYPAKMFQTNGEGKPKEEVSWQPSEVVRTYQFFALVIMFTISSQSAFLVIANAKSLMEASVKGIPFLQENAWVLVFYFGVVCLLSHWVAGIYLDKIGKINAYCLNSAFSAIALFSLPYIVHTKGFLLFIPVGVICWQYAGGLVIMPKYTIDYFGPKHFSANYGLVFIGWGLGFFMVQLGSAFEDATGILNYAFYLSGAVVVAGVILAQLTRKPLHPDERFLAAAFKRRT